MLIFLVLQLPALLKPEVRALLVRAALSRSAAASAFAFEAPAGVSAFAPAAPHRGCCLLPALPASSGAAVAL